MNDKTNDIDRRKEDAIASDSSPIQGDKVYLLVDGQKTGPYNKDEVAQMLESKEVLVTDSVSVNGHEWFNLHQWAEFDRRTSHSEELPGQPQVNLFLSSDDEVTQNLETKNDEYIEKEVIAGLAYIGNINSGKRAQHHSDKFTKTEDQTSLPSSLPELEPLTFDKKSTSKETYMWGAVLSFALVGIIYLFFTPSKTPKKVAAQKAATARSKVQRSVASKVNKKVSRNVIKPTKRKMLKARKRTPSFAKSKAFKNRAPRRAPVKRKIQKPVVEDPDDYYYDDGTDAVELDPIRSKVAKETFDPEDDEGLDSLQDEYDAEREPASEEEDPEKAFEALYE